MCVRFCSRLSPDDGSKLTFDGLTIDKQAYELVIGGKRVDAPPKEIELLYFWRKARTGSLRVHSFWTMFGALIILVIPVP